MKGQNEGAEGINGGSPLAIYDTVTEGDPAGQVRPGGEIRPDEQITQEDVGFVRANFAQRCTPNCKTDFTGDGKINEVDADVVAEHLGKKGLKDTTAQPSSENPEPERLIMVVDPEALEKDIANLFTKYSLKRVADGSGQGFEGVDTNKLMIEFRSQDPESLLAELMGEEIVVSAEEGGFSEPH